MKHIIFLFAFCIVHFTLVAQAPEKINYQGVARDNSGNVLANTTIGLRLSIHAVSGSGSMVYRETHSVTTNAFGLFSVQIGIGGNVVGTFSSITWGINPYYIETELDPAGGTSYTSLGTQQLVSVPYSLYSKESFRTAAVSGSTNRVAKFTTDGTTIGNSMLYDNGSAVGIGTDSPQNLVHFHGSGNSALQFTTSGTGSGATDGVQLGIGPGSTYLVTYENTDLSIGIANNATEEIYIKANGMVGIGTQSPISKLHVVEPTAAYTAISGYNTYVGNTDGTGVLGVSNNNGYYGIGVSGSGGYRGLSGYADGGSATQSVYGVYGNAVGTAGTRYGVFGSAGGGTTNYGVYCSGSGGYTGTWTQISDEKFKTDVTPLNSALTLVNKLNPVSYQLKTKEYPMMNFPDERQYGFIAQELEQVFPLLVESGSHPGATKEDEDIKLKAVNYIGMVPVLTKAIQEQQRIIDELKTELQQQRKEIQELKK